ncbi:MAG: sulfatase-like hydrolase/transferase [bacterium]
MKRPSQNYLSWTRRQFLTRTALGAGFITVGSYSIYQSLASVTTPLQRKPNIILIVADDLGYGELGCQGNPEIPTPNIDSIAKNGVRFTNGYVSAPLCSPSRAGLMTGRYQQRFGHEFNPGPATSAADDFGLPLSETLLPARLKELGYKTGMVGKWHLGFKPEYHPMQRGFDEFFGFLGGAHSYIRPRGDGGSLLRGTEALTEQEYLTDAFAREAAAFITQHHKEPFFLYLPFNAVHAPLEALEKYLDRFKTIDDSQRRTYAAMTSAMDDAVGSVLAALREFKIEEDTLLFFISDNGGPTPQTTSSNYPLRGFKSQILEGGIRIPFIVQWKGHLPAGVVETRPAISLDIHPTALVAAGGAITPEMKFDGVNLLPYLSKDRTDRPHNKLYWRMGNKYAFRFGDWKLVKEQGESEWSLFNLAEDIGEKENLAKAQLERVKEMSRMYEEWEAGTEKPKWVRQTGNVDDVRRVLRQGIRNEKQLANRFRQLDRDRSGGLTLDEFSNEQIFKEIDRNHDGIVTLEEARAYFLQRGR